MSMCDQPALPEWGSEVLFLAQMTNHTTGLGSYLSGDGIE